MKIKLDLCDFMIGWFDNCKYVRVFPNKVDGEGIIYYSLMLSMLKL